MDKPETIGRVEAVLIMPLIFMSGLFFPLSSYPEAVADVVRHLPTTALFEGARQTIVAGTFSGVYAANIWITASASFVAAVLIFRRRLSE
jgi:lipooligosaccharide transport system permease protein